MQKVKVKDVEIYLKSLDDKIKCLQKEKRIILKKMKEGNVPLELLIKPKHKLEFEEGTLIVEI